MNIEEITRLQQTAENASALLKAMCNQHRLMILCQLATGEKCVGEIEKAVSLGQSALSQHLALLRKEGLVETRRQSQTILYSLKGKEAVAIINTLHGLYCPSNPASAE